MTDDLKERLRDLGKMVSIGHVCPPAGTYMLNAADRIEALEAALRSVIADAEECPCNSETDPFIVAIQDTARTALAGEKKDG